MRVWLVELELAEGAIGRLTHHEVLPRGVNVTEAGCSGLVSKSAPPPADWKATVVTRCATSVMYTAAARASACIGGGGTRPARASVQTLERTWTASARADASCNSAFPSANWKCGWVGSGDGGVPRLFSTACSV